MRITKIHFIACFAPLRALREISCCVSFSQRALRTATDAKKGDHLIGLQ